jgi:hypothetical protein
MPEEVGCHMQKRVPPCSSGTVKKEHPQDNWDPGKLWTMQQVGRCRNEDDPPCQSGMAQGKLRQEGLDQEPSRTRNPETMNRRGETVKKTECKNGIRDRGLR